jgi:hypothetical protein
MESWSRAVELLDERGFPRIERIDERSTPAEMLLC